MTELWLATVISLAPQGPLVIQLEDSVPAGSTSSDDSAQSVPLDTTASPTADVSKHTYFWLANTLQDVPHEKVQIHKHLLHTVVLNQHFLPLTSSQFEICTCIDPNKISFSLPQRVSVVADCATR